MIVRSTFRNLSILTRTHSGGLAGASMRPVFVGGERHSLPCGSIRGARGVEPESGGPMGVV